MTTTAAREDDFIKDLAEFLLANAIYSALAEAHACEQKFGE